MKWQPKPNVQWFVSFGFGLLCYIDLLPWYWRLFFGFACFVTSKKSFIGVWWWHVKHQRNAEFNRVDVKWLPWFITEANPFIMLGILFALKIILW